MLNKTIHDFRFMLPPLSPNLEGDVLVLDKPIKCTSFDLVNRVKNYLRKTCKVKIKVGHAGTLDPLASGVLIICIGSFTKKIAHYQAQEKEYTGTFTLGATTLSFDLEQPVDARFPYEHITLDLAQQIAQTFVGEIAQVPPIYSAVRIAGRRAFNYARNGQEVEIEPKNITIYSFEITRFALPEIDFKIVCSKGTYIRSLARDFGLALNSGAHLSALRRTRIGEFRVEEAIQPIKLDLPET
ncbi:MAG: tRNA pseudouridine(55) synthase TruB [Bacteroidales bacterium]|jgi:tRNA pseudouridine55 synthase|nr:tRNA pseudouridine(55) synthase TruB [Bacteroidales bacterium]